jgi:hypothetical protein
MCVCVYTPHCHFLTNVGHSHLVSLLVQLQSVDNGTCKRNYRKMQQHQ